MSWFNPFSWFNDDSSASSTDSSLSISVPVINPATGAPMLDDNIGGVDATGHIYGDDGNSIIDHAGGSSLSFDEDWSGGFGGGCGGFDDF